MNGSPIRWPVCYFYSMRLIYVFLILLPFSVFGKKSKEVKKELIFTDSIALPRGISVNALRSVEDAGYLLSTPSGILSYRDNKFMWLSRLPSQSLVKAAFTFYNNVEKELIISLNRSDNVIVAFHWDRFSDSLIPISAGEIPSSVDLVTDIQLLPSPSGLKANVCGSRGMLEVLSFYDPGWGQLDATVLETRMSPFPVKSLSTNSVYQCGVNSDKGWWCETIEGGDKMIFNLPKQKKFKGLIINAGVAIGHRFLVSFSDNKLYEFDINQKKLMCIYSFPDSLKVQKVHHMTATPDGQISMVITLNDKLYLSKIKLPK
jgi:hypothetical protein